MKITNIRMWHLKLIFKTANLNMTYSPSPLL